MTLAHDGEQRIDGRQRRRVQRDRMPYQRHQRQRDEHQPRRDPAAPLGWYGGSTQTMLPLPGSAAICAGSVSLIPAGATTDQRGFPRLNLNNSSCVDAGAVQTNYLIVTTTTDQVDGTPDCASGSGSTCSLRDALTLANPAGADVAFASNVTGTINLSTVNTPRCRVTAVWTCSGPGANNPYGLERASFECGQHIHRHLLERSAPSCSPWKQFQPLAAASAAVAR